MSARMVALTVLSQVFSEQAYAGIALDRELKKSSLDVRDKAFASKMVYGVIQNLTFIDYQIEKASDIKLKKILPVILNLLRLSVYQIFFLDKVPDSAAVNEAVTITKKLHLSKTAGFVNAVLRCIIREGKKLPDADDKIQYFSVLYSYPKWLVRLWLSELGEENLPKMLAAGNEEALTAIRVNRTKIGIDDFLKNVDGVNAQTEYGVVLKNCGDIKKIYGFNEGYFTVQDTSSQMVGHLLAPKRGESVLDVCSAPGGKTTHIAELMENEGEVVAWDLYEHKRRLVEDTAARLGLSIIKPYVHDAKVFKEELAETFDKVLVDAPCSGLGIIRKKPDIKWKRKPSDIELLQKEQFEILTVSSKYVKIGGVLLYSTCTVSDAENTGVIEKFLKENTNFVIDGNPKVLYPYLDNTDGFFICRMIKTG